MIAFISLYLFLIENSFARSLKATADKLGQETIRLGLSLAIFGLAAGTIMLVLGKQDAAQKITSGLLGVLLLSLTPTIVTFIKGLA
jgi:hypothetical protein